MTNGKPRIKLKEIFSTEVFAPFSRTPHAVFDSLGRVAEAIRDTFGFDDVQIERGENFIEGSRDDGIYFWLAPEGIGVGFDEFLEDGDAYYYLLEAGNIINEFSSNITYSGVELEITGRNLLEGASGVDFFSELLSKPAKNLFMRKEKIAHLFTISHTFSIREEPLLAIVKIERGTDPTITGNDGFWLSSHQLMEKIIIGKESDYIKLVENYIYFKYSITVKPEEPLTDLNRSVFLAYMVYHTAEKEFFEFKTPKELQR